MMEVLNRSPLSLSLAATVIAVTSLSASAREAHSADGRHTPNVVIIFADDLGYGDLPGFSDTGIRTPNLDKLIAKGRRYTSFYVSQPVCTASRASLMSGCYANRLSLEGALNHTSRNGIHPDEFLIPELFKSQGYATAIYGKWHLGTLAEFHPASTGFDDWVGIPYSNDNSKYHPVLSTEMPPLPLYHNERVIELDPDQSMFTSRLTEHATDFIRQHNSKPFFLYVPHVMPHVPIFASDKFRGKSGLGLYADVIEELDWSIGQITLALEEADLTENTLVIFTSDNGPFLSYGDHAGAAGKFRGGKLTAFEGGVRMPCIMSWPGRIPSGTTCDEVACTIDLLPTFMSWFKHPPVANTIDGLDISPLLFEENAKTPHESCAFYVGRELHAVRQGKYKLHFPHPYLEVWGDPGRDGKPSGWGETTAKSITQSGVEGIASRHGYRVKYFTEPQLYDLATDPAESTNVAADHAEIVQQISAIAEHYRMDLGDALTNRQGTGIRPCGLAP